MLTLACVSSTFVSLSICHVSSSEIGYWLPCGMVYWATQNSYFFQFYYTSVYTLDFLFKICIQLVDG